jgi:hypothetical protein
MRTLAFCICALASSTIGAADPELLAKITSRQAALDEYSVEMHISVFGGSSPVADLQFPARSMRRGAATLQEFRNFVVLLHPEMRLVVDRSDRTIHLNDARAEPSAMPGMDPAAILEQAASTGYAISTEQTPREITLGFSAASRPAYLLAFDVADLLLSRMEMDAPRESGGGRTVVTYDWKPVSTISAERLTPHHYVRHGRGGWEAAPAFAGYRIVVSHGK